jgi:hypothetical protein
MTGFGPNAAAWRALDAALDAFRRSGKTARLWWRDDDAEIVTPELERLATRAETYRIPLTLAVIPAGASKDLREFLARGDGWTALVHGFAHKSYAPQGEKRAEFGAHRPVPRMWDELCIALDRLRAILPGAVRPVLVPPWNRIAPVLLPRLAAIGFEAVSTFGPRPRRPVLPMLNCHLDIMNWRSRRFAGAQVILDKFSALLELQLREPAGAEEPIGLLTHHRQHDEAAEDFLDALAARLDTCSAARWLCVDEALGTAQAEAVSSLAPRAVEATG